MGSSRTTDGRSICRSRSDKDHPLPVRRSPLSSTSAPLFFWSPDLFVMSTGKYPSECHGGRSEEHTSELQSQFHLVCRLLLEKKKPSTCILLPTTLSYPL